MPRLIKYISAEAIEENIARIDGFKSIEGIVGMGDYINVFYLTAYLQNFIKVTELVEFPDLVYYGIVSNSNKTFTEIEISY